LQIVALVKPFGQFADDNVAEICAGTIYVVAFLPEMVSVRQFGFVDGDRMVPCRFYEIRLPGIEALQNLIQKVLRRTVFWVLIPVFDDLS